MFCHSRVSDWLHGTYWLPSFAPCFDSKNKNVVKSAASPAVAGRVERESLAAAQHRVEVVVVVVVAPAAVAATQRYKLHLQAEFEPQDITLPVQGLKIGAFKLRTN